MALLSENFALFIFIIILISALIISIYMQNYKTFDRSWVHTFIVVLIGLGIFITFLFYYNVVALQNQEQQLAIVQELSRMNESALNSVLNSIKESSLIIPYFVKSISPLINYNTINPDEENAQTITQRSNLSYRIFSLWQDSIWSDRLIDVDQTPYITNFLQRANSQLLFREWLINRINFCSKTQRLGDLLFEYGLPIKKQIPESYVLAAQNLMKDSRYVGIF
jgi:hypothetical protein